MNGQSINRSSMKYNIPARTLRDWMKRLNIKSVFTHHSQKEGRSLSADSASDYSNAEMNTNANETNSDGETSISPKPDLEASGEDTSKVTKVLSRLSNRIWEVQLIFLLHKLDCVLILIRAVPPLLDFT